MTSVAMAMSLTSATQKGLLKQPTTCQSFLMPMPTRPSKAAFSWKSMATPPARSASLSEREGIDRTNSSRINSSMVIPEAAEAAGPGIFPSLKNFLLSIVAGGVVLTAIVGAVIGVSNFDPVRRS